MILFQVAEISSLQKLKLCKLKKRKVEVLY